MLTHINIDRRLTQIIEKAEEARSRNQRNLEQGLGVGYMYGDFAELVELAGHICAHLNERKKEPA